MAGVAQIGDQGFAGKRFSHRGIYIRCRMKITIVTPAGKGERSGNRATAVRWARVLRKLGHRVEIITEYERPQADLLVAIHAWRSAGSVERYRADMPDGRLIVCLAGTDIYRFQHSHPEETLRTMARADRLVCLHGLVGRSIPAAYRRKLAVIRQSAPPLRRAAPATRHFDVLVIGHLRDEKDPFRAAHAARALSGASRIRILQMGKALDPAFAAAAATEMRENRRYRWLGEIPRHIVRQRMTRARAMVISSRMEGGANVVSEAVMAGLPVLASRIDGNVGLLGEDYPGYFPLEDTEALTGLLERIEREPAFLAALDRHIAKLVPAFTEDREIAAWRELLVQITDAA